MSDLPFKYPIFTIPGLDPKKWWEGVNPHYDEDSITLLDRHDRKDYEEIGRIVVDAKGRSWRIISMTDLGVDASGAWKKFWAHVFGVHRVRFELSDELHLSLDDIKESICTIIRAKPDAWRDDEAIAGEGGVEPRDEQEMLEELIAKIRKAKNSRQIVKVIDSPD